MLSMKLFFLVLILVSVTASRNKRLVEQSWERRVFDALKDNDLQEQNQAHERRAYKNNEYLEEEEELLADRRSNNDDDEDGYLDLDTRRASMKSNGGPVITLQNRAAMNTRLRVLYTDDSGTPSIAETGRLWIGQTKSVTLPAGAKNIKVIVEKDILAENWRVAYTGPLAGPSQCIRITGVTLASHTKPCK